MGHFRDRFVRLSLINPEKLISKEKVFDDVFKAYLKRAGLNKASPKEKIAKARLWRTIFWLWVFVSPRIKSPIRRFQKIPNPDFTVISGYIYIQEKIYLRKAKKSYKETSFTFRAITGFIAGNKRSFGRLDDEERKALLEALFRDSPAGITSSLGRSAIEESCLSDISEFLSPSNPLESGFGAHPDKGTRPPSAGPASSAVITILINAYEQPHSRVLMLTEGQLRKFNRFYPANIIAKNYLQAENCFELNIDSYFKLLDPKLKGAVQSIGCDFNARAKKLNITDLKARLKLLSGIIADRFPRLLDESAYSIFVSMMAVNDLRKLGATRDFTK